jgi:hypothetical protein
MGRACLEDGMKAQDYFEKRVPRDELVEMLVEQFETEHRLRGLLRRANYFLEFVPIGMNDEDIKRFHQLMDELAAELEDEDG